MDFFKIANSRTIIMSKELYTIHKIDARKINSLVATPIVDVTITSPPYFEMKDYGYKEQIGYGQSYKAYLDDLNIVFQNVFNITKDTGTLWVIIDAFREKGEVVPLPFDFANRIKEIGWKLQEIIIWEKDKTVPWVHKGQMRNSFEYILMFSKSQKYNFYVDRVRDCESLKKWWVKYPERYNPKGKTPNAIWKFNIPSQGSWGNGYIRHFCPLPEEMIAQILKLTTNKGGVVLDPFSGSGAVLSMADNMSRKYIGTELNPEYINMFLNYLKETGEKKKKEFELSEKHQYERSKFEKLILDLRALKYARIIYQKLNKEEIQKIFVEISKSKSTKANSVIVVNYYIKYKTNKKDIEVELNKIISKAPLSKFGIEPNFIFIKESAEFASLLKVKEIFIYTNNVTHKFKNKLDLDQLHKLSKSEIILSQIMVDLEEKDYE